MSIQGRNATFGSTLTVYRPTTGDDAITWAAVSGLTDFKLDLMPVTDEIRRNVFGEDANIETMALDHTKTILKGDGLVVTAGAYAGERFRASRALVFHTFTQLGLVATTEVIPGPPASLDTTAVYLTLAPTDVTLAVDDTAALTAVVLNAAFEVLPDAVVTYLSSDDLVATVDSDGVVTAIAEGAAIITATSGAASDTSTVTVTA